MGESKGQYRLTEKMMHEILFSHYVVVVGLVGNFAIVFGVNLQECATVLFTPCTLVVVTY